MNEKDILSALRAATTEQIPEHADMGSVTVDMGGDLGEVELYLIDASRRTRRRIVSEVFNSDDGTLDERLNLAGLRAIAECVVARRGDPESRIWTLAQLHAIDESPVDASWIADLTKPALAVIPEVRTVFQRTGLKIEGIDLDAMDAIYGEPEDDESEGEEDAAPEMEDTEKKS